MQSSLLVCGCAAKLISSTSERISELISKLLISRTSDSDQGFMIAHEIMHWVELQVPFQITLTGLKRLENNVESMLTLDTVQTLPLPLPFGTFRGIWDDAALTNGLNMFGSKAFASFCSLLIPNFRYRNVLDGTRSGDTSYSSV
jgi:hypothetical protein